MKMPKNSRLDAEVALADEDEQAGAPGEQDRSEVAGARQVEPGDPPPGQPQQVAVAHEITGEEHLEHDLRDLAGLEREAAEPDPDPRAVDDAVAGREHGGIASRIRPTTIAV